MTIQLHLRWQTGNNEPNQTYIRSIASNIVILFTLTSTNAP